jgi:hypothetical protein
MNRRDLVASALSTGIAVHAGCLGARESPSVGGRTVQVAPGERATLEIAAKNVGAIRFESLPAADAVAVETDAATMTPVPSERNDSSPPCWFWSRTRPNVDLEVPVRADDDTTPGEYGYAITVWDDDDRDDAESVTKAPTITVANP